MLARVPFASRGPTSSPMKNPFSLDGRTQQNSIRLGSSEDPVVLDVRCLCFCICGFGSALGVYISSPPLCLRIEELWRGCHLRPGGACPLVIFLGQWRSPAPSLSSAILCPPGLRPPPVAGWSSVYLAWLLPPALQCRLAPPALGFIWVSCFQGLR